jgi:hypothetical protein
MRFFSRPGSIDEEPDLEPFIYAPLDHQKASLRLIRVLGATSPGGYIQCEIRNGSVNDSYICLSYIWGAEEHGRLIILNNRAFRVRSNLHDFLRRGRHKERLLREWLWIDALSIDQSNVKERNHQVQQMGNIYSRAKEVLSWLGNDCTRDISFDTVTDPESDSFRHHEYWNRAWITQEVVLAQHVTLCIQEKEIDLARLDRPHEPFPRAIETLRPSAKQKLKGRSLIYLIDQFEDKDSHDPRDKVYSLLALSGDGSELQVDYNSSIETLAKSTLRCCKRSFCFCSLRVVASALGLGDYYHQYDVNASEEAVPELFAYVDLPFFKGGLPAWPCRYESNEVWPARNGGSCQAVDCDGTAYSHTPGFAQQLSSNGGFLVAIFPRSICGSGANLRIEITVIPGRRCSTWDAIAYIRGRRKTVERGRYPGCIVVSSGFSCKVYFTFEFLNNIGHRMAQIQTCDRVALKELDNRNSIEDSILQLCYQDSATQEVATPEELDQSPSCCSSCLSS